MSDWIKDMNRCTGPKPDEKMSDAPELAPLPEPPSDRKLWTWAYTSSDMRSYALAYGAPLLAEIERLKTLQLSSTGRLDVMWQELVKERDELRAKLETAQKKMAELNTILDGAENDAKTDAQRAYEQGHQDGYIAARAERPDPLEGKFGMWPIERLK